MIGQWFPQHDKKVEDQECGNGVKRCFDNNSGF